MTLLWLARAVVLRQTDLALGCHGGVCHQKLVLVE